MRLHIQIHPNFSVNKKRQRGHVANSRASIRVGENLDSLAQGLQVEGAWMAKSG